MVVNDISTTLSFYQVAFPHWKIKRQGQSDWYGKTRNWVHFGDDYQYLTFNDNGIGENRNLSSHQVGLAHIGFVTNNLDALIERLEIAGFNNLKKGRIDQFRKNEYFLDLDGFEVEFVEYFSDNPAERNLSTD